MHSTDHNLNNPTIVDQMGVAPDINLEKHATVVSLTQYEYDRIAEPDPYTQYIISDSIDGKSYYGRNELKRSNNHYKYAISPSIMIDSEWDILEIGHRGVSLIGSCNDIDDAVSVIRQLSNCGEDGSMINHLYGAVENYIRYNITLDEAIVGIILAFGIDRDDPDLQKLTSWLVMKEDRRTNQKMERELDFLVNKIPGGIASLYKRIYDWFLVNDFFIKFHKVKDDEPIPIGDELMKLHQEYIEWVLIG